MSKLVYRREIDGLRAVAVLSVLVYHAKLTFLGVTVLPGGFLGVDVFFVISGYLISLILLSEVRSTGRIDVVEFYHRRARRILPALLVVILCSVPFAWSILLPTEFTRYAWSLIASVFFVSNFFWERALTEYGAQSSLFEPFVHTWSLAVEEQFYLLFPLALLMLSRRPGLVLPVLLFGVFAGLPAAEYLTAKKASVSFFWLPSRAWELLTGAVLAYGALNAPQALRAPVLQKWAAPTGLCAILASVMLVDLDRMAHPGLVTVPLVAGTAAVIWFGSGRDVATTVLSSRPFVGVGLISYSLYLWHYPVFAFGRQLNPSEPLQDKAVWFVLSFVLAVLTYVLIETPFRNRRRMAFRPFALATAAATLVVVGVAIAVVRGDGLPDRLAGLTEIYAGNEIDNERLGAQTYSIVREIAERLRTDPDDEHALKVSWYDDADPRPRLLIVGDSHGQDTFNAFHLTPELANRFQLARFHLRAPVAQADIEQLIAAPNFQQADLALLSMRFSTTNWLPGLIQAIKAEGKVLVMASRTVEFDPVGGLPVFDWYVQKNRGLGDPAELGRIGYDNRADPVRVTNDILERIAQKHDVPLLRKSDYICVDDQQVCDMVTADGKKAFYDYGHYTLDGARHFGQRMVQIGWFRY